MANYFITSNGTEVGKTHIMTGFCHYLQHNKNKKVMALKPLESGWSDNNSDVVKILQSLSLPITSANINLISHQRFNTPLAPNMAARIEGAKLDFSAIMQFCRQHLDRYDYLFIEGAGGIMSPLTDNTTYRNLLDELQIPVIFIAATYLGTISHTLTALEALKNFTVKVIVLNPFPHSASVDPNEVQSYLQQFTDIPIIQYNDDLSSFDTMDLF